MDFQNEPKEQLKNLEKEITEKQREIIQLKKEKKALEKYMRDVGWLPKKSSNKPKRKKT